MILEIIAKNRAKRMRWSSRWNSYVREHMRMKRGFALELRLKDEKNERQDD